MTVYIIQEPKPNKHGWKPNIEPASRFGKLKYIFRADFQPCEDTAIALDIVAAALKHYDVRHDYILWPNAGDPAALWSVLLYLGARASFVTLLYWNRPHREQPGFYYPVTFNLQPFGDSHGNR